MDRIRTSSAAVPAVLVGALALALVAADQWLSSPTGAHASEWSEMRYPLEHILARQKRIADAMIACANGGTRTFIDLQNAGLKAMEETLSPSAAAQRTPKRQMV